MTHRERAIADADRVRGYMVAVIAGARQAKVEVPVGITTSVEIWQLWADRLRQWVEK